MIYIHHDLQCLVYLLYFKKGYNLMFFLVVTAFFFFSSFSSVRYLISFSSMLPDFQASTAMLPLEIGLLTNALSFFYLYFSAKDCVTWTCKASNWTRGPHRTTTSPQSQPEERFFILKSTLITELNELCTHSSSIKSGTNWTNCLSTWTFN